MKLIEKDTNRVIEINMYIVDDDMKHKSMDISSDFFDCEELKVTDVYYCIDYVKDWVAGKGDFAFEDCGGNRLAVIDNICYSNYGV